VLERLPLDGAAHMNGGPFSCSADAMKAEQRFLNLDAQLLRFHSPLLFSFLPFPELPLSRLALRVFSRGRDSPPYIRGGEEVKYRPAASLVR
jgi:hypothetical protein